jgi:hypothetical protein
MHNLVNNEDLFGHGCCWVLKSYNKTLVTIPDSSSLLCMFMCVKVIISCFTATMFDNMIHFDHLKNLPIFAIFCSVETDG